ncbi:MAG: hypothetical protein WC656_07990 [Sulfurimonas sp.]|jgi:hypothetical protein
MEIGSLLFLSLMNIIFGDKSCEEKYKDEEERDRCIKIRETYFRKQREEYLKKLEENEKFKAMLEKFYAEHNKFIQDSLAEYDYQDMINKLQISDIKSVEEHLADMLKWLELKIENNSLSKVSKNDDFNF